MSIGDGYSQYHIILWNRNGIVKNYEMHFLSFEFLNEELDYLMLLKFDFPDSFASHHIPPLIQSLESIYNDEERTLVLLTNRKEPPLYSVKAGEYIYSFSCKLSHFKHTVYQCTATDFFNKNLLFEMLDTIFLGESCFTKILVRQIPIQASPKISQRDCDVVVPHRGDESYINNMLSFLNPLRNINVRVGIDMKMSTALWAIKDKYQDISFYLFHPNPVGPYVIRNYLISQGSRNLIFYQDSDDVPCSDRFERIAAYMDETGCELCGSHELRMDYFDRTVRAFRFPKDVKAALEKEPGHPLLHPTSAITREAFYRCGRLSEDRTFGNDTKFLLRSFFFLKDIRNVDEFLYIRRRRPCSLTTAPETMIGSPLRRKLLHSWNQDFVWVKSGQLPLESSSLIYQPPSFDYKVKKI
jgi:hypothetical protein